MTNEDDYLKLYKRAIENLPKDSKDAGERFEMPKFDSFLEGTTTIIKNFTEIAGIIERDAAHLQKYLCLETGARNELDGPRLRLNTAKNTAFLNQKLETYVNEFVLCRTCKKPDTEIRITEDGPKIKCKACGALYTIRQI